MTAGNNYVNYYLSTDANITSADTYLGQQLISGSLATGASSSTSTTVMVPGTLAPGAYYIRAIPDGTNDPIETN